MPATSTNQYSAASLVLTLGGVPVGFLRSIEGGEPVGQVVDEAVDATGTVKKHIGTVSFQPIVLTFGVGMDKSVYQWMADTLGRKPSQKTGAVIFADYNYKEKYRLEFNNALITAIGFPAVDAAAADAGFFTLTLQPQTAAVNTAFLGSNIQGFATSTTKRWLLSNFRLKVGGLEAACSRTNAVEALTATQPVTTGKRAAPGVLAIPDLVFTVAESAAQDILTWATDFLVNRKNDQPSERSGTLEFLDTTLKTVLFTVNFVNLGVIRAHRQRAEEQAGVIARVRVQLYCEQMSLVPDSSVIGAALAPPATSTQDTSGDRSSLLLGDTLLNIVAGRLTPETALRSVLNLPSTSQIPAAGPTSLPEIVAQRLLTTARPVPEGPVVPDWSDGVALGGQWASQIGTIDELTAIKTINQDNWSALKLDPGHSLVGLLRSQGMIPAGADGPLQLERDAFVEGIVAGAIQVLGQAAPHLASLTQST